MFLEYFLLSNFLLLIITGPTISPSKTLTLEPTSPPTRIPTLVPSLAPTTPTSAPSLSIQMIGIIFFW